MEKIQVIAASLCFMKLKPLDIPFRNDPWKRIQYSKLTGPFACKYDKEDYTNLAKTQAILWSSSFFFCCFSLFASAKGKTHTNVGQVAFTKSNYKK